MNITVFGANGRVGQLVVKLLLDRGQKVTAFVHSANPFQESDRLMVTKGDINNQKSVAKSLENSDAVISTLGSWGSKSKDILCSGMKSIIPAMKLQNVSKIVSLTGSEAEAEGDDLGFVHKAAHTAMKLSPAGKILADGEKHIQLLSESDLDWVVIRSPIMNEKGNPKDYSLSSHRPTPWATVNRQSVAICLVDMLETTNFDKSAPYISRSSGH